MKLNTTSPVKRQPPEELTQATTTTTTTTTLLPQGLYRRRDLLTAAVAGKATVGLGLGQGLPELSWGSPPPRALKPWLP